MERVRIGRDGLCPLGSGRKFKRCCTQNHLFYSPSGDARVPVDSMRPRELPRGETGLTSAIQAISPPRRGFVELYGIEVEEVDTYFVGDETGSALVNNGMGD